MSQANSSELRRMRTGLGWVLFALQLLIVPYVLVTIAGVVLMGSHFYELPLDTLVIPGPWFQIAAATRYWPVIVSAGLQLLCVLIAVTGKTICLTRIEDGPTRGLVLASICCDLIMITIESIVVLPELVGRPIIVQVLTAWYGQVEGLFGLLARLAVLLGLWLWLVFCGRMAVYLSRLGPAEDAGWIRHTILGLMLGFVIPAGAWLAVVKLKLELPERVGTVLLISLWCWTSALVIVTFVIWIRTQLLHVRLRTALHDAELLATQKPILI
jgi:hypothetical protein